MADSPKLHCDHCGTDVLVSGLSAKLIGFPCPACAESMLSHGDFVIAWLVGMVIEFLRFVRVFQARGHKPVAGDVPIHIRASASGVKIRRGKR